MNAEKIWDQASIEQMFKQMVEACDRIDYYLSSRFDFDRPSQTELDHVLYAEFASMSQSQQHKLYRDVLRYNNLLVSEIEREVDVCNSPHFTRSSLAVMGIRVCDAIHSYIREDSVVEHFDCEFRQTWRSLSFFKFSSYPMKTLFIRPFQVNFKKSPERVEGQIAQALVKLQTGEHMFLTDITEEHEIIEVDSPKRMRNIGQAKFVAPTYFEGKRFGVISVIDVKRSTQAVREGR